MGLLSQLFVPAKDAQGKPMTSGSPNSPLRHIPSFNEFVGDAIAPEAEAESARFTEQSSIADTAVPKGGPASPPVKPDIWRSVFDPGSNPNMHRVGGRAFDNVSDCKSSPTTWDYILQAESTRASFGSLDAGRKGYIDEGDLRAAFDHKYDTAALMDQADANRDGRITRAEFDAVANNSA